MNDLVIGVVVLGAVFGGALFRMFLKRVLSDQHLSTDARDVIRMVMAMLATLSAVAGARWLLCKGAGPVLVAVEEDSEEGLWRAGEGR
jgi:hypothetical protein